jgi:hypothetical protein
MVVLYVATAVCGCCSTPHKPEAEVAEANFYLLKAPSRKVWLFLPHLSSCLFRNTVVTLRYIANKFVVLHPGT